MFELCLSDEYPREFEARVHMLAKCYDRSHPEYRFEGARGIKVDRTMRESFEGFMSVIGPMPGGES